MECRRKSWVRGNIYPETNGGDLLKKGWITPVKK